MYSLREIEHLKNGYYVFDKKTWFGGGGGESSGGGKKGCRFSVNAFLWCCVCIKSFQKKTTIAAKTIFYT